MSAEEVSLWQQRCGQEALQFSTLALSLGRETLKIYRESLGYYLPLPESPPALPHQNEKEASCASPRRFELRVVAALLPTSSDPKSKLVILIT